MERLQSPVYLSAEDAMVPKSCRFCNSLMEIKQINLTVAVRQCYKCSTPLEHLDISDIQFFQRSYEDKDQSPLDWRPVTNTEEEELSHLQSWIEQLNITINKYEESSDDDMSFCSSNEFRENSWSLSDEVKFDDFVSQVQNGTIIPNQEVGNEWNHGDLDELDALLEQVSGHKSQILAELPFSPHDLLFCREETSQGTSTVKNYSKSERVCDTDIPSKSSELNVNNECDNLIDVPSSCDLVVTSTAEKCEVNDWTGSEMYSEVESVSSGKKAENDLQLLLNDHMGTFETTQKEKHISGVAGTSTSEDKNVKLLCGNSDGICDTEEGIIDKRRVADEDTSEVVNTELLVEEAEIDKSSERIDMISPVEFNNSHATIITYSPRQFGCSLKESINSVNVHESCNQEGVAIERLPPNTPALRINSIPSDIWSTDVILQLSDSTQLLTNVLVYDSKDDELQLSSQTPCDNQCVDLKLPDLSLSSQGDVVEQDLKGEVCGIPSDLYKVVFSPVVLTPQKGNINNAQESPDESHLEPGHLCKETVSLYESKDCSVSTLTSCTTSILVTIPADSDITSEMLESLPFEDIPIFIEGPNNVLVQATKAGETVTDFAQISSNTYENDMLEDVVKARVSSPSPLDQSYDISLEKAKPAFEFLPNSPLSNQYLVSQNDLSDEINKLSTVCVDQPLKIKGVLLEEDDEELKAFAGTKFKPVPNRKVPLKEGRLETGTRRLNLLKAMQREVAKATVSKRNK